MPALPWVERSRPEPDRDYLIMASRLPLRRRRDVPGFLRDSLRIRRQLARTKGLVGYGLDARLWRRTFYTFSVWEDRASLDVFTAAEPHRGVMEGMRARVAGSRFEFYTALGSHLPTTWEERTSRLRDR